MQKRQGYREKILLFVLIVGLSLIACGRQVTSDIQLSKISDLTPVPLQEGERLRVLATTSIVGDIVGNVGGNLVELSILVPVGADPHSFSPTPQDVAAVSEAHVIFINGAGLEQFLGPLLQSVRGSAPVISLSEGVPLRRFSPVRKGGEEEVDPHTWMSPANVIIFVQNIEKALVALDPAHANEYHQNAQTYRARLEELDAWVQEQIAQIPPENRKIVTDHEAFGYYADRYGLQQIGAVIPGFSAAAEPSAKDLAALQEAIRRYGAKAIFVGVSVNPTLARRIAEDTGIRVVRLYTGSLGPEGSGAETYIDFIRYNTKAIVEALR
ncbi:MAG: zinc ABC transporter substrate-binding protein [Anaerolineae bacterium]|nr:zinc ABC transporter substrate-binding protein [Anaerolineae bacterium]